jgi:hypothetical protein
MNSGSRIGPPGVFGQVLCAPNKHPNNNTPQSHLPLIPDIGSRPAQGTGISPCKPGKLQS